MSIKMKVFKYILCSLFVCSLTSCNNFLEETPETALGKSGIYNSESSAKAALAGCYASMADYNGYSYSYYHTLEGTSGLGVSLKSNDVNLTSMDILSTDINVSNTYGALYNTIKSANDIIDGMKQSTISNVLEKNRISGEAYFIRAISYFNLVRLFGKVSLIIQPVTSYDEAQQPRADVSKVYELIINDLDSAFIKLPMPVDKLVGHPHKYAAEALLAKVYLTLAGNDVSSEYWQKCYDVAKDVYDNGGYSLVRPYGALFGSANKNNAESIFEIQFSSSVEGGCRLTETTFPVGHEIMSNVVSMGNSWGKSRPSKLAFDMFDSDDPRREASFVYGQYINKFEAGNKKNILLYPTKKVAAAKVKLVYKIGDSEYPAWKKYADPMMTASASSCNFVYMRYADLLLILAEASNEIGKSDDATTYLNMVLDRARDANGDGQISVATEKYPLAVSDAEKKDKSAFRERVLTERLKELTGECDAWYTIRRRGEYYLKSIMQKNNQQIQNWFTSQKINASSVKFVYLYTITDENVKKNMLLPFPENEIMRNGEISQEEQNYGY